MMIYDVAFLEQFIPPEGINKYKDLCEYFRSDEFSKKWYDNNNIFYLEYWVTPRCNKGTKDDMIYVPIYFYFKLLILRGRESRSRFTRLYNYKLAFEAVKLPYMKYRKRIDELLFTDPSPMFESFSS